MDVLIAPQTQHKSHIQKVMFLSVIGVPQVVEYEGKVYNFDGKIGLFPCTEKKPTQRRSKAGPKGTMVEVNRNVDSDFYEELFTMKGGVFDMIEKKCPWLRGKSHCISIAEKMMHVQEAFKAYPKDKITDIWGCYFNNLRGIMKETGGNQYKPAHNDSRNRRKETGSPIDLSVNLEDYISCLDFLSD